MPGFVLASYGLSIDHLLLDLPMFWDDTNVLCSCAPDRNLDASFASTLIQGYTRIDCSLV